MICPVCGSANPRPIYRGLVRCTECTFVWADQSLNAGELRDIYGQRYFLGGEYSDYLAEEQILKINFRVILRHLQRHLPSRPQRLALLEIGSAYGFFLDLAQKTFDVTGIELNPQAASFAVQRGHHVLAGDFLDITLPEGAYDLVVCLATLEHLQYPNRYVAKIARSLKPGGLFYYSTCDIDSWFARLSGPRWRMVHPPTHLSYFSTNTLSRLLNRFGLTVIEWKRFWQFRSVGTGIHAITQRSAHLAGVYRLFDQFGVTRWTFAFNFGDLIFGVARKQPNSPSL